MPKVFTLTCNLLAQYSLSFDKIKRDVVNRAKESEFCVGGKGVNVARALLKLGVDARAVIFSGGRVGERCEDFLREKEIPFLAIKTAFETRTGFVCQDENSETTFFTTDSTLTDVDFDLAMTEILKLAKSGDVLALCGSVPNWNLNKFNSLKALLKKSKMRFVCDTYGAPLKDLFFEKSEILKINFDEFSTFANGKSFNELKEKTGAKFFGVTDGANQARASINGKVKTFMPKKIEGRAFATGCGDVVLSSLIKSLLENDKCTFSDFENAMSLATSYARG